MSGYHEPWFLVTTALDLSAAQVVEVCAARVRQEDGFRDHTQRLGMEACRAWSKEPVRRTFQVHMVALTRSIPYWLMCSHRTTCDNITG